MSTTEQKLIDDVAAALGVDLAENATLGEARLKILTAIESLQENLQCSRRDCGTVRRKFRNWRKRATKNFYHTL